MPDLYKDALETIISNKQIKTVFQPIISLKDGSVLGHEALSRITCESEINNPEMLFTVASEYNRLWDLELLCRTTALETAFKFMIPPYDKMLFINVNPNTMHDENFIKGFTKEFLMHYEMKPNNIIFEITERNVISDMDAFLLTIEHYKSQDYKIAIDDTGSGYSGLNLISDVNPNYIKIDMKLIRDIDSDRLKYALVRGMVEISKASNIILIAEGIETFEEMETLIKLGVQYGQGYYIQRPNAVVSDINPEVLNVIEEINQKANEGFMGTISNTHIKSICSYTAIVSPNVSALFVYNIFKHNPDFFGLCVIENDVPIGIITQEKLALKMSGHYGFSLNQNKPIHEIMDKCFLSVEDKMPISAVSYLAMARPNDKLYDFIVVTDHGNYIGTVTIKDLLQKTTEIEVTNAINQNPLSGLPGNMMVEQRLNQCIESNRKFSVAYIDIDNFKAYNDVYGFENGDLIIKLLANILKTNISSENFIGHIGGDDFLVIIYHYVTDDYFKDIVNQFEFGVLSFYNQSDINQGYIVTNNRRGETEKFPLISLTAVVLNNEDQVYHNVYELTELLAALKRKEKNRKLSYFI